MPQNNLPFVPETITVHLGTPDSSAQNVTLSFPDYIKNVASSEIFPTWPEAALRANIYVQTTFALNRVYTEWYRSRGYGFDITSSTQYDQAFVYGRDIFSNISRLVDELFNNYIVRQGSVAPLFSAFCNGTTVTCGGLSQWGTVTLANNGLTPYEILQYYYGSDINIVRNAPVEPYIGSYPGVPFGFGTYGNEVRQIQQELNRIAANYPAIPIITPANGNYGESTVQAVNTFQSIFGLAQTGIIDKQTWYKIKFIFTAVKGLSELTGENLTEQETALEFPRELQQGDFGFEVRYVQFFLNVISYFNPDIPTVNSAGVFNEAMREQVTAFERFYGLNPDGVIDFRTWQLIREVYTNILENLPEGYAGSTAALYPGYTLTPGLRSDDVRELQTYLRTIGQNIAALPTVEVTGYYGEQTENAVAAFQELYGLPVTGAVSALTWDAIAKEYNYLRFGMQRTG